MIIGYKSIEWIIQAGFGKEMCPFSNFNVSTIMDGFHLSPRRSFNQLCFNFNF